MIFSPTILGTGLGGLAFLNQTRDQQQNILRETSAVSRDIDAVRDRLTKVQNVDELLDDRPVLQVVLGAFGLQEDIDNRAFLRGVLLSDLNDPGSAANRLSEPKYRELARTFNFGAGTGATFPGASAVDTLTPQLQALGSVDELFEPANNRLLSRALEVFGVEADAGRTVFLKRILESDLSDSNSLANRIGDQKYIDFVEIFQTDVDRLPEALRGKVSDTVASQLREARSGSDITGDARLLEAVLTQFGLADQVRNPGLISAVLDSDLTDPKSLANRLSDTRFRDLASAFDFSARQAEDTTIFALAEIAKNNPESLESAEKLLENDELLSTALSVFGLDPDKQDKDFLKQILEADPDLEADQSSAAAANDPAYILTLEENAKYVAFSKAFGFGEALANPNSSKETRIEKLIEAVGQNTTQLQSVGGFMRNIGLFLATTNLFDLPPGERLSRQGERVLSSDTNAPFSPYNLTRDDNFRHLYHALNIQEEDQTYSYPTGFTDSIINSYVERQFEIAVGQQDNDMRLMISLERDLGDALRQSSTNDGRWFRVMGNPTLRKVFEGALALPQSIGQLDLNRQLEVFKEKSEQAFGTSDLSELAATENIQGLQRRYFLFAPLLGGTAAAPANPVLSLLL